MSRRGERRRRGNALLDATLLNDMAQMRELLTQGVSADVRDAEHQETPLMLAKCEAAARLLLEHGADAALRDADGQTAQDMVCESGLTAIAKRLQAAGK